MPHTLTIAPKVPTNGDVLVALQTLVNAGATQQTVDNQIVIYLPVDWPRIIPGGE